MWVLGINSVYHESSVCLVKDGQAVFAIEEERISRQKHGKSARVDNPHQLPHLAMDAALQWGGLDLADIEKIGFSFDPSIERPLFEEATTPDSWGTCEGEKRFHKQLTSLPKHLCELGFSGQFQWWEHHLCHAASVYHTSNLESAAIMVTDGIGERASSVLGRGQGKDIELFEPVNYPHSLGFLWEYLSQFLGFTAYDAAKVMGMAASGDASRYREALSQLIWSTDQGGFAVNTKQLPFRCPSFSSLAELFHLPASPKVEELQPGHFDVAAALQQATDEVLRNRVNHLYCLTQEKHLCLSGGVALNCVSNRRLFEEGPFQELSIFSGSHDAGTAIGAALLCAQKQNAQLSHSNFPPYLGPDYNSQDIEKALKKGRLRYTKLDDVAKEAAERLSRGEIVGWFQGRMEFGPRALGNRSILADPRDPIMRERLNRIIKHRESFRPFAPSVLEEELSNWFMVKKTTLASRSMLLAYPIQPDRRDLVSAIVHQDGSCRVQSVAKTANPIFHRLISEFASLTGIPMVLNTFFNDPEPIVCTPESAIATYLKTPLDTLILGPFLVTRRE